MFKWSKLSAIKPLSHLWFSKYFRATVFNHKGHTHIFVYNNICFEASICNELRQKMTFTANFGNSPFYRMNATHLNFSCSLVMPADAEHSHISKA